MFRLDAPYRRLLLLSAAVGILAGLFCAGFYFIWHSLDQLLWHILTNPLNRIWVSALAGFVIGIILKLFFDPGSMATIIRHFHVSGSLPLRDNLPTQPASLIGLLAGQSAGPEGALTQAGGSMGSYVARRTGHTHLTGLLTLAGMGAGFGAFLGAPVGGAILWLEMLHTRGLEYYEAIIPTILSSSIGYLTMLFLVGHGLVPPWHLPEGVSYSYWNPVVAIGIGLFCGPVAKLYAAVFSVMPRLINHSSLPLIVQTTLAGLIIGILGWSVPESYFYGGNEIIPVIITVFSPLYLLAILFAKMIAASVTVRGHWQGGLIIPNIFMGAILGKLLIPIFPSIDHSLAILVSMVAFNSAATQTPLASALIVLALTGAGAPVPVFLASLAAFLAGQGVTLIENKQRRDLNKTFRGVPLDGRDSVSMDEHSP